MDTLMKRLVRIRLVNWHYFENELICINGSALISGENTAGKSTVLDAIQLVLTTNSRKFNMAANEKGSRDLKGYVRCKLGNVGETYRRKGTVPANVALEFFEEKTENYFVLGVHLLSQDEESPVVKRWYAEECRLEDLSFLTDGRPSLAEEFRNRTRKIKYDETDKAARDRFQHRMGNLDEKFFDIIPKSLAFKPMDNVKAFINKFVLSEGRVDVEGLRKNIQYLDELEGTLEKTKKQLDELNDILKTFDAIEEKEYDIRVNEILLLLAEKDALAISIEELKSDTDIKKQTISGINDRQKEYEKTIRDLDREITDLKVSISNNESSRLVEGLKNRMIVLENDLLDKKADIAHLEDATEKLKAYVNKVNHLLDQKIEGRADIPLLTKAGYEEEKTKCIACLSKHMSLDYQEYVTQSEERKFRIREMDDAIEALRKRQESLEKRQLKYPSPTELLKKLIEEEYKKRGVESSVYILSDLLELTDERWRDAVEGYLNTQKFYLVVEPKYYDIAIEAYDKNRSRIHSAGIINTKKIPMEYEENHKSLAYVIKTDNRYAKAYIQYILGRVIRCDAVNELDEYNIAITPECMLYQGYVVRHLNPKDYRDPYIGANAYRVQLENVRRELEECSQKRKQMRTEMEKYATVVDAGSEVNMDMIRLYKDRPTLVKNLESEMADVRAELKTAEKDPTLIELNMKLDEKQERQESVRKEKETENKERIKLEYQVEEGIKDMAEKEGQFSAKKQTLEEKFEISGREYSAARDKYEQNKKSKEPQKIYENFKPQRTHFENEKAYYEQELYKKQSEFNARFSLDFTIGVSESGQYREAADRLKRVEVVRYEEKLRTARSDCERVFRSDFLSRMKEYIETAKQEFKSLNKALENVYYGDDSYHFHITFDKRKESLYRMITSEYNMEGELNVWTSAFEAEYKDEIEDLFAKLMVGDDKGEKVIEEYTDYRSYLDYDIEIRKRSGQRQRFSDIYGEKSGSETQVPYYVAIAASFYQLYRFGNSVRLMLLDEAFDKMDDDRIKSMLEFMKGLNLQVIMATPPPKIEIIGEQVGTVLTAIREGDRSIIEEYEL